MEPLWLYFGSQVHCKNIRWLFLGIILSVIGFGCTKKAGNAPNKPEETYKYTRMELEKEKYLSTLNIPVQIPVTLLQEQINNQLKGIIYEDDSSEDLKVKIRKAGDIQVQAIDSIFLFDIPLDIWAEVAYNVSPLGFKIQGKKDTRFAMRLKLISNLSFSSDWKLNSDTRIDSYDWITEPTVRVKGINIPVKMMVSRLLNQNQDEITKAIDEKVPSAIEIKSYVQQAWEMANQPFLISKEYNTWLLALPKKVMMSPLQVEKGVLNAKIGIEGFTQTITSSEKPQPTLNYQLPKLEITDRIPKDFQIGLTSQITYKEAANLAKQNLAGKKFSFSGDKYSVEVTDIELYGQNEKLIIKASLKGSINGVVYLKGSPFYDTEKMEVALRDVDFDLDSQNFIYNSAAWLLKGKFAKMLEKQMVFQIGDQIKEAYATIGKSLSKNKISKGVELDGQLLSIQPDKVYLTPDFICAVVFANGKIKLNISELM